MKGFFTVLKCCSLKIGMITAVVMFLGCSAQGFDLLETLNDESVRKGINMIGQHIEDSVVDKKTPEKPAKSNHSKKPPKELSNNNHSQAPYRETYSEPLIGGEQDSGLWSKYDFVSGDRIILEDDLSNEETGEFPSRWDLIDGNAEVARFGGEKVIFFSARKTKILPLISDMSFLSDAFTMEFDLYFDEGIDQRDWSFFNLYFWGKGKSAQKDFHKISMSRERAWIGMGSSGSTKKYVQDMNIYPGWHHVALSFNNRSLKMYIGEKRVINIPNIKTGNNTPIKIILQRDYSYDNDDLNQGVFIKNIRIAKGGKKLYDRLMADGKITSRGILFAPGNATIKPQSIGTIKKISELMKEHPEIVFSIEGHTDSDGSTADNQKLSEERAASVREKLISMGISASRLKSKGWGESAPTDSNNTAEGKANNRRVEFVKI